MFFRQKIDKNIENDDDLETLVLRLETSSYTEDKLDTLQLLYDYSLRDPISTGTYSLNAIIESIKDLEDISYNMKILLTVFKSAYRCEFVDLLLKKDDNIEILIDNYTKDSDMIYELLKILSESEKFTKRLILCKNVSYYLVKGLDDGKYEVVLKVIPISEDFRKQLLFEGIFEKIQSKLEDQYYELCMTLTETLLKDNHFNQNYFIETNWTVYLKYLQSKTYEVFKVLSSLVDNTNGNIHYIKKQIYRVVDFPTCVKYEQYLFIYRMIYNDLFFLNEYIAIYNKVSFEESVGRILKEEMNSIADVQRESSTTSIEVTKVYLVIYYILNNQIIKFKQKDANTALLLISEVLIYSDLYTKADEYLRSQENKQIANGLTDSNYTNTFNDLLYRNITKDEDLFYSLLLIFTVRDIPTDCLVFENIPININTILFILFSFDSPKVQPITQSIVEIIYDGSKEYNLKCFCVLLCLMHDIRLNFNDSMCLKYLKKTRFFLSSIDVQSNFFLPDDCINILLDKINEIILKYSERVKRDDLLNYVK